MVSTKTQASTALAIAAATLIAACGGSPADSSRMTNVVSGVVHLPAPNATIPVPGASVQILSGRRAGERYATDESGRFSLPPIVDAEVALMFTRDNFDPKRVDVSGVADDRPLDIEMSPQQVRETWSGTINSRYENPSVYSILEGWPNFDALIVETHIAGDVSLHLEADCAVAGTYTDFGFWMRPAQEPAPPPYTNPLLQVWSWGGEGAGTPAGTVRRFQWNDRKTLAARQYRLVGELSGYLGGPCAWTMTLEHPY